MPLVRLASGDNDSNAFVNQLGSKGLLLGASSKLTVLNFSVNPAERLGIVTGSNDTFTWKLDERAATSFTVTIPAGEYNTLAELVPVLTRAMNDSCQIQAFRDSSSKNDIMCGSAAEVRVLRQAHKPTGFRISVFGPIPPSDPNWGAGDAGLHQMVAPTGPSVTRADKSVTGYDGSYAVCEPLARGAGEFAAQISGVKPGKGTTYIFDGYLGLAADVPARPNPLNAAEQLLFGARLRHGRNIRVNWPGEGGYNTGKPATRQTAILFRRAGDTMYFYYKDNGQSATEQWKDLAPAYTAGNLPDVLHPVLALADAANFVGISFMPDITSVPLPALQEEERSVAPLSQPTVVRQELEDGSNVILGAVNTSTVKLFTWGNAGATLGFTSTTTRSDASQLVTVHSERTALGSDEHPALSVHCPSLPVHSINGTLSRVDHCIVDAPKTELIAVGGDNKLVWQPAFPVVLPIGYASPTRVSELRIEIRDSDGNLAALRGRSTICLLVDE